MAKFGDRLKHAWNAFTSTEDPLRELSVGSAYGSFGGRPDRSRMYFSNERSIISSIYTRLGVDCSSIELRHVRTDDEERYLEDINSGLNNCLTLEANLDQ